jgi:hypothetical protein
MPDVSEPGHLGRSFRIAVKKTDHHYLDPTVPLAV